MIQFSPSLLCSGFARDQLCAGDRLDFVRHLLPDSGSSFAERAKGISLRIIQFLFDAWPKVFD
jgi:hypothetical protein